MAGRGGNLRGNLVLKKILNKLCSPLTVVFGEDPICAEVTPKDGAVFQVEVVNPVADIEIVCASTDGRPLAYNPSTDLLTELGGGEIADGATAVACSGKDYEPITKCMENADGKWQVHSFVNTEDPTDVVGPLFCNPAGVIVEDPGDLVPCEDPEPKTIQCWKDKFIEGGLDNTFTNFNHTNQVFSVTFDNGDVDTFNIASATGWTDQVSQMATGLDGIMPWAQTVESFFAPNGGGGLPAPFVALNQMFARYVGFRVCPGDKVPVSVEYTSDQVAKPKQLVIQYVETPTIFIDKCVSCDPDVPATYTVDGEPYEPVCAIPCSEEFPEVPLSACVTQTLEGLWCDVDVDTLEDPDDDSDPLIQSDIIVIAQSCEGSPPVLTYFTIEDGALIEYEVQGEIRSCEDYNESPNPDAPCRPEGSYTGKTFCYEKKGKFVLIEKQFEGKAGTVDVSADLGLPAGSVIATTDATIFTGGNSDILAVNQDTTATFTVAGTQPVCIRVQHGGSIPTDGGSDGFTANDGVPYAFTGNITGDGSASQSGNDYAVTSVTDNVQGALNWTSQGPATSATATTTNANAANSVRFWVATFDCGCASEYVSDCGSIVQWWDGNEQVDISTLTKSDCCDPPAAQSFPTTTCKSGNAVWHNPKTSIWIGTPEQDPTVTHCVIIDGGAPICATITNDGDKTAMVAALMAEFAAQGLTTVITDINPDGGSQISFEVEVPCGTESVGLTIEGVVSTQQSTNAEFLSEECEEKDAVQTLGCLDEQILDAIECLKPKLVPVDCPDAAGGASFGDCDCDIEANAFDPDTGRGRDQITYNGDGTYTVNGGTTAGLLTRWAFGGQAEDTDFCIMHVEVNGGSNTEPTDTGWLMVNRDQIVNVITNNFPVSTSFIWDPRIGVNGKGCRLDDITAAIVEQQGSPFFNAATAQTLLSGAQVTTNGAGIIPTSSSVFNLNGYAWGTGGTAEIDTADHFPGNRFGRCYTLTPDENCDAGQTNMATPTQDACVAALLAKQCEKIEQLTAAVIANKPFAVIESCDGSQLWTVCADGTTNGPFDNPSNGGGEGGSTEPTLPSAGRKLVSDNFQDGNGNTLFNLQIRNAIANAANWQALIENAPYATIPSLSAGAYTLATRVNGDGTYNHLFSGTSPLNGFQNITITGDVPTPAGSGSGLSLFCEAA